jgi:hypothetical protein
MRNGRRSLRELTFEELEYISGGDEEDIIVTGTRYPPPYYPPPYYPPPYYPPPYGGGGGYYPPSPPPPPPDSASHDVTVNLDESTLSEDEKQALKDFRDSVARHDAWVKNLPDDVQLRLDNGQIITGKEYKEAWANTDFVVNPAGTNYANNSFRGEANYNNGNPIVSININVINGYNDHAGGTDFLVGHEVAHLTSDQRSHLSSVTNDADGYTESDRVAHERMANDIARAIAAYNNGTIMANPGDGYSASNPSFQSPPPPPPPPPPPSGGGGGWYHEP